MNSIFKTTKKNSPASDECDGCGHEYAEDEEFISGIDSCCGGCWRSLCKKCIIIMYKLIGH